MDTEKKNRTLHEPNARLVDDISKVLEDAQTIARVLHQKNIERAENIPITEEAFELRFRERPGAEITVQLPLDVIASLEQVARTRDMSALIRFYIGQSLRHDLLEMYLEKHKDM